MEVSKKALIQAVEILNIIKEQNVKTILVTNAPFDEVKDIVYFNLAVCYMNLDNGSLLKFLLDEIDLFYK